MQTLTFMLGHRSSYNFLKVIVCLYVLKINVNFCFVFERVINFAIINRKFIQDEELTQKGTFKRKIIIKNFEEIISPMYQKNYATLSYNKYQIYLKE